MFSYMTVLNFSSLSARSKFGDPLYDLNSLLTSMHIYIHKYMHTCKHTNMYTNIHICKHTRIHKYLHTSIYTYIHTYIHTYMHTCIRTCIMHKRRWEPVAAVIKQEDKNKAERERQVERNNLLERVQI